MEELNVVAEVRRAASGILVGGDFGVGTGRPLTESSPLDGTARAPVATGTKTEALQAIRASEEARSVLSEMSNEDRATALRKIAQEFAQADQDQWARLISEETGKRLAEAKAELGFSALYFSSYADMIESVGDEDRAQTFAEGTRHYVRSRAAGVVAVLTPWNFPVSIPARKIAAALAAGCTVVFKPSELAPLSGMVLSRLLDRVIPGCVNTVLGLPDDVVNPWLEHPAVNAVSFTGSTEVGRLVAAKAATRFLRQVLELGGCSPFVILPGTDIERAADLLLVAKFRNNGQSCIAANQIFVHHSIAEGFTREFCERVEAMTMGDPFDPAVDLGPLAPREDPRRLAAIVDEAIAQGATRIGSRQAAPEAGHYFPPTVLIDPLLDSRAFATEVFGPVAPIRTYSELSDVLAYDRASPYGLAGYVCGPDEADALAVANHLSGGIVGVNTATPNHPAVPFGGTGISGVGYEGGVRGMEAFADSQTIASTEL